MTPRSFVEIAVATSVDIHPPLYYWLLASWAAVFGQGELALRGLSVLFGTLTVWVTWRLGRFVGGQGGRAGGGGAAGGFAAGGAVQPGSADVRAGRAAGSGEQLGGAGVLARAAGGRHAEAAAGAVGCWVRVAGGRTALHPLLRLAGGGGAGLVRQSCAAADPSVADRAVVRAFWWHRDAALFAVVAGGAAADRLLPWIGIAAAGLGAGAGQRERHVHRDCHHAVRVSGGIGAVPGAGGAGYGVAGMAGTRQPPPPSPLPRARERGPRCPPSPAPGEGAEGRGALRSTSCCSGSSFPSLASSCSPRRARSTSRAS